MKKIDSYCFEIRFGADIKQIDMLDQYIESIAKDWLLTDKIIFSLNLILEELISNIIMHGFANKRSDNFVKSTLTIKNGTIEIVIVDNADEFNPLSASEDVIKDRLQDQQIGGLGIHLVKKYVSSMNYFRENEINKLKVVLDL